MNWLDHCLWFLARFFEDATAGSTFDHADVVRLLPVGLFGSHEWKMASCFLVSHNHEAHNDDEPV